MGRRAIGLRWPASLAPFLAHLLQTVPLARLGGNIRSSYRGPVCKGYRLLLDAIPSRFEVVSGLEVLGDGGVPLEFRGVGPLNFKHPSVSSL
eukprot:938827-Amphidinium_carterae.1